MSEITKEQIDEILHKNTLIIGENIPDKFFVFYPRILTSARDIF